MIHGNHLQSFYSLTVKRVPQMVVKKIQTGLIITGLSVFVLSGCSTVSKGVDSLGQGIISLGESFERAATDVEVKKLADDQFALAQTFEEPVKSLDSWALRIEAREVCPDGYVYLSRNARKAGGFAYSEAQCSGEMDCTYQLEWQIRCEDVPEEPFSLFGKT